MVTDNQKTATTIVLLATVLLLVLVPIGHTIPLVFAADKHGLLTGFSHAQGQVWYQHPDQQQQPLHTKSGIILAAMEMVQESLS